MPVGEGRLRSPVDASDLSVEISYGSTTRIGRPPTFREGLTQVIEAWFEDGTVSETAEGYEWAG